MQRAAPPPDERTAAREEALEVRPGHRERPSLELHFPYGNAAALFGYGTVRMWARPERDEIRVTAIMDAPAKEARWRGCVQAELVADGRRIELAPDYIGRPMGTAGTYDAVRVELGIHDLRRIARAARVHGTVCGDPIALTASQRRSIARFVRWFDRIARPRRGAGAPPFRAVGPELERLPHEEADPGPYEA